MFKAIIIEQAEKGQASVVELNDTDLPPEGVTVDVSYSTLNYKDALAITGSSPIIKSFPMVPGVDLVGRVAVSDDSSVQPGQLVLATGQGLGEKHWGGLAQRARVPADWLIPLPVPLTERDAMALGTAGLTAVLCVRALLRSGAAPDKGPVLVTGATGGVGSVAVYLLARRGFRVVASTGRPEEKDYLTRLGAEDVIDRAVLSEPGKPLAKQQWAAAVDVAGGHTLANICAGLQYGGVVAACGLAQSMDFPASVAPFILRGVQLLGIDSVYTSYEERLACWNELAQDWDAERLADLAQTVSLDEAIDKAGDLLTDRLRGRVVVDVKR